MSKYLNPSCNYMCFIRRHEFYPRNVHVQGFYIILRISSYYSPIEHVSVFSQATQTPTVSRGIALLFLGPRHQMGWGSTPSPGRLYPREIRSTHCTVGWVGPRAGLDGRKFSSPPGFDPGPSSPQSVAIPTELPGPPIKHVMSVFCHDLHQSSNIFCVQCVCVFFFFAERRMI